VDIHSVGSGGGSIAYLTPVGALRVGPQSAGADPGPACYGRGGDQPTVTDANVVLHRIPPGARLGGTIELDEEAARRAVDTIAAGLGADTLTTAQAILDIVNENMHAALRVVSVERGYDPREFGLLAFGGAGPLHANALGRLIHSDPVIIPSTPGVLSAFGFLAADVQNEFARTYLRIAEETPADHLLTSLEELRGEADSWLHREEVGAGDRAFEYFADCRYYMQDIQIPVRVELEAVGDGHHELIRGNFETEHRRLYGFELDAPLEIATLRVVGRGAIRELDLAEAEGGAPADAAIDREEDVYFDGDWRRTPIYDRSRLRVGQVLEGPAVVVQLDATAVIEPGYRAEVDRFANIIISGMERT
jgi:N-methylhydantoinase A